MNAFELLEALPVMLWTARADGVWTHVNERWAGYTGIIGTMPGYGFEAALHPDDVAPTLARWRSAVMSGAPYRTEYRLRRTDGLYRWHLCHGTRTPGLSAEVAWTGAVVDIHDQKLAEEQARHTRETAVRALGLALEARDQETKGHTDRVTELAVRLGERARLPEEDLRALRLGAYLHDIGKMAVADAILLKPGPLSSDERAQMQQHVASGVQFAAALDFLSADTLDVIRAHHERWDGAGYPAGLSSSGIPLLARIFAVVDVYDALQSVRPYKPAWTPAQALAEIQAQSGRQFDPGLVTLFTEMVRGQLDATPEDAPRADAATAVSFHLQTVSEHIRATALHEASISVLITDAHQRLLYVNPEFSRVTGYAPEEVIGRNPRFLQGPDTSQADRQALHDALTAGLPVQQLILNHTRSGEPIWFEMHITPIYVRGELEYYVAIQSVKNDWVEAKRQLEHAARHDALTGLLNRFTLAQVAQSPLGHGALILLDVDNLKQVNDRHGHPAGDDALQAVASALLAHLPAGGQAFRLGGDEFQVLLPVEAGTQTGEQAAAYIGRCRATLAARTDGVAVSVSVGVALYPEEGGEYRGLVALADARLYRNKPQVGAARPADGAARGG